MRWTLVIPQIWTPPTKKPSVSSRIRSRILPDSRAQSAYSNRYNEDRELAQNIQRRNFNPYQANFSGGSQGQQQQGMNPAYIGCVEGEQEEVEPENTERPETPFIGYFVTKLHDSARGPSYYPIQIDRNSYQNRGGYFSRRGGRGRGGYAQGPPRYENGPDQRLYYLNTSEGGMLQTNNNISIQQNSNATLSSPKGSPETNDGEPDPESHDIEPSSRRSASYAPGPLERTA